MKMQSTNYTVVEAVEALNNDQQISVVSLTVDGQKAVRGAVAELTQSVEGWSNRQADSTGAFLAELAPEIDRLAEHKAALTELVTAMHNTDGPQTDLQAQFFTLETQVKALADRVLEKHARIEPMLADLLDPVGSFSRAQTKFPTLRRQYLAAFGK